MTDQNQQNDKNLVLKELVKTIENNKKLFALGQQVFEKHNEAVNLSLVSDIFRTTIELQRVNTKLFAGCAKERKYCLVSVNLSRIL